MASDEEEVEESSKFVPRPRPGTRTNSLPRRFTSASQIISNPKLVKSLETLELDPQAIPLSRPLSCANLSKGEKLEFTRISGTNRNNRNTSGKKCCPAYQGILLSIFAGIVFSVYSVVVQRLHTRYYPWTLSFWTFLGGGLIPAVVCAGFAVISPGTCERWFSFRRQEGGGTRCDVFLLLVLGIIGPCGIVLKMGYSLNVISLAASALFTSSSPIFVIVMAWIFLKEKSGLVVPLLSTIGLIVGAASILQPNWKTVDDYEFDSDFLIGCCMMFGSMIIGQVMTPIILRKIRKVPYPLIILVCGLIGCIVSAILAFPFGGLQIPETLADWFGAVAVGVLYFLGQTGLIIALKVEESVPVSFFRALEATMPLFILLGPELFRHWMSWLGTSFVLISLLVMIVWKIILTKRNSEFIP